MGSQDGVVNIWTRIGDGQSGWNPGRGRKFLLLCNAQFGSGTQPIFQFSGHQGSIRGKTVEQ